MQLPGTIYSLQNFSIKWFLIFFLKKSALKKFLIFSQKKVFLRFSEKNVFLIFQEKKLSIPKKKHFKREFSELKKLKKTFWKSFLYFGKCSFLTLRLKMFDKGNLESLKFKNLLCFFSHFLFLERKLFKHKHKSKKFLILSLIMN